MSWLFTSDGQIIWKKKSLYAYICMLPERQQHRTIIKHSDSEHLGEIINNSQSLFSKLLTDTACLLLCV